MQLPDATILETLLVEASRIHGRLCPGQILGVRMAISGLRKIGVEDPNSLDKKSLIIYVEMDRCAADAIQCVTGCTLGKRTLKFIDYGKMAATFVNLRTSKAIRLIAKEDAREKAKMYFPWTEDKYLCQMEAYKMMPDDELFDFMIVKVCIPIQDMPGRPRTRVRCEVCGEYIQDMREIRIDGKVLCKACCYGRYYIIEKESTNCE